MISANQKKVPPDNRFVTISLVNLFTSIFLFICFLVQPFFTLIFSVIIGLFLNTKSSSRVYVIAILGALYLGLVNLTKIPESDLIYYLDAFNQAKILNLTEYFIVHTREPLYSVLVYMMSNINFLNDRHFLIASTFIPYVIFLVSVVRLCLHLNINNRSIIALVVLLLFFPQIFNLSAHLIRQFISSSICIYVIVQYLTTGKVSILLAIAAFFIHFFVALFFFLVVILKFSYSKKISASLALISSVFIMSLGYLIIYIGALNFVDNPLFGAILTRVINPAGIIDHAPMSLSQYAFSAAILGCSSYNLIGTARPFRTINFEVIHRAIIVFCILVIASSFVSTFSEVTLRFSMFLYFCCGIVFPYTLLKVNKKFNSEPVLVMLIPIMIMLFLSNSQFGVWQYADVTELLGYSFLGFWQFQ